MFKVLKPSMVTVDHSNRVTLLHSDKHTRTDKAKAPAIKQDTEKESAERVAADMISRAKRDADAIVASANSDASNILLAAQNSAKELEAEMQAAGYKEGYDKGYSEGAAKAAALTKKAEQTLENAQRTRQKMIDSAESDMVQLVAGLTSKILMDSLYINPQLITVLIKQGLSMSAVIGDVVIRVSDIDYEAALAGKEDIAKMVEGSSKLEILKDLSLKLGDCIIETPYGNIDCSLDGQLNILLNNLFLIYNNSVDNNQ